MHDYYYNILLILILIMIILKFINSPLLTICPLKQCHPIDYTYVASELFATD